MKKLPVLLCGILLLLSSASCAGFFDQSRSGSDDPSAEEEQTVTFTVNYDYGMYTKDRVTPLLNSCLVFFDFAEYGLASLLAGDELEVDYTGEMYVLEMYPGKVVINGEITDVRKKASPSVAEVQYAETGLVSVDGTALKGKTPQYVVSEDKTFTELTKTEINSTLYASYDPITLETYALYDYDPSPVFKAEELFSWIASLERSDIRSVEREDYYIGVKPGTPTTVKRSDAEGDIDRIFEYLNTLTLQKARGSEGQIDGGSGIRLTVYTDGKEYTMSESNGYFCVDNAYYRSGQDMLDITEGITENGATE